MSPISPPCNIVSMLLEPRLRHERISLTVLPVAVLLYGSSEATCSILYNNYLVTFDGTTYTFPAKKKYILAQSCDPSPTYHISYDFAHECNSDFSVCSGSVKVSIGESLVYLYPNGDILLGDGTKLPDPTTIHGIQVYGCGNNMVVTGLEAGLTLVYDGENSLYLLAPTTLSSHLCGLCGHYNNDTSDEAAMFEGSAGVEAAYYWVDPVDLRNNPVLENQDIRIEFCTEYFTSLNGDWALEVFTQEWCEADISARFSHCVSPSFLASLTHVCREEFCQCRDSLGGLVHECLWAARCTVAAEASMACGRSRVVVDGWRQDWGCDEPVCQSNLAYSDASTMCGKSCGFHAHMADCDDILCDGCFCTQGSVWNDTQCIDPAICPCRKMGDAQIYHNGDSVDFPNCETCSCVSHGAWQCTPSHVTCPATCHVLAGFYTTFDNRQLAFRGSCLYTLVMYQGDDLHSAFVIYYQPGSCSGNTCTESKIFKFDHGDHVTTITLSADNHVTVNEQTTQLPYWSSNFTIHAITNDIIEVATNAGVYVYYAGPDHVHVTLDSFYRNKVRGLCGNFNSDISDDNRTPTGDIVESVAVLADEWKLWAFCTSVDPGPPDQCSKSSEYTLAVERFCEHLTDGEFVQCNSMVDVSWYHSLCIDSMCRCEGGIYDAHCRCFAAYAYAKQCARKGIVLNWRDDYICPEPVCTGGRTYQACGSSCVQLCGYPQVTCVEECLDGCVCAKDEWWDGETSKCVNLTDCPCLLNDVYWAVGSSHTIDCANCTCVAGNWTCGPDNCQDYVSCAAGMEWSNCSECGTTCSNHLTPCSTMICRTWGCVCSNGTVYSALTNECVNVTACQCTFMGRTYHDGEMIMKDCNKCVCENGYMVCEENVCQSTCEAAGEPHMRTFDNYWYDFGGSCEYVLSTDNCLGQNGTFSVEYTNVDCGTQGLVCKKHVKVYAGTRLYKMGPTELGSFSVVDNPRNWYGNATVLYSESYRGMMYELNLSNNVTVSWDGDTRVMVTLQPEWSGRVCGLCGNNDRRSNNDLVTSTGQTVANVYTFGNSWRVSLICPAAAPTQHPCERHPERRAWAEAECAIIMSLMFADCHLVVSYEQYYERCVYDACSCDMGGDCRCYCDAVTRYAFECGLYGMCVKWRSCYTCPMQPPDKIQTYIACDSSVIQPSCGNPVPTHIDNTTLALTEVNRCPSGYLLYLEKCVLQEDCPCYLDAGVYGDNVTFTYGTCDNCSCISGVVDCTCVTTTPSTTTALTIPSTTMVMSTSTTPAVTVTTIVTTISPLPNCTADLSECIVYMNCSDTILYNGLIPPSSYPLMYSECQAKYQSECCPTGTDPVPSASLCVARETPCEPCDYCLENGVLVAKQEGEVCMVLGCPCVCSRSNNQTSMYCDPSCAAAKTTPMPLKKCARKERSLIYINTGDCTSVAPVQHYMCHGYCESFAGHATTTTLVQECSCCMPSALVILTVNMTCANGTMVSMTYNEIVDCGCQEVCTINNLGTFSNPDVIGLV